MSLRRGVRTLGEILGAFWDDPKLSFRRLRNLARPLRGFLYAGEWTPYASENESPNYSRGQAGAEVANPLREYFDSHSARRGIWKWIHYFDIYHRHLKKFVGREVHVLEIGVYSGGSLEMWKHYFGAACRVYGVDIKDACKVYENDQTRIFIGNQGDRKFWKLFKAQVPALDVLIDDGGHHTNQQIVTLEEILPHLRPGGIYICEDLVGCLRGFVTYVYGLADQLNAARPEGAPPTPFQQSIASIHLYPWMIVIEKNQTCREPFVSRRQGTEWQPFYRKIKDSSD